MDFLPHYSEILTEGRQLTIRSECKMMGFDSASNREILFCHHDCRKPVKILIWPIYNGSTDRIAGTNGTWLRWSDTFLQHITHRTCLNQLLSCFMTGVIISRVPFTIDIYSPF